MPIQKSFLFEKPNRDKATGSPAEKSLTTPTEALRELIRRALKNKIEPESYFQAVQLIREHGDFNLGKLFAAINQMEDLEEQRKKEEG